MWRLSGGCSCSPSSISRRVDEGPAMSDRSSGASAAHTDAAHPPPSVRLRLPRKLGNCVDGPRAHMRTYQKHLLPSVMSSPYRFSLPIPCRDLRQGKNFPAMLRVRDRNLLILRGLSTAWGKFSRCFPAGREKSAAWLSVRGACYHDGEKKEPGMGTAWKYAVIDPATGKLDRRIFSDEAVYG